MKDIVAGTGSGTLTSFTTSEDAFLFGAASNGACSLFQSDGSGSGTTALFSFPQSIFVNLIKTFDHKTFYYTGDQQRLFGVFVQTNYWSGCAG